MDAAHIAQKSASHGSLRSSYKVHDRAVHDPQSRPPSQRRPLRSVNKNAAILRCPGPLESMLKTTTETGDIGIFSIKASVPPAAYHSAPRSRTTISDAGHSSRSRSRLCDASFGQDDHKWARSHRDTTSEIISLYATDHQSSYMRSVSPQLDDGHKSYSMTTCSSRQIPSQKSTGTLESQSSGSGLQRPRSPFPYPTRLKRPGVQPASPALGENGGIDYSKMVELDRVSQRTVHGSYKSPYSHGVRRPPPLSLRNDNNNSASSLVLKSSPGPYFYGQGQGRVRTPGSSHPWSSRHHDRHRRGSVDQSIRSSSLTSIVEMYQRPNVTSNAYPPLRTTGSFYHDYSEEFDKQPLQIAQPDAPICPIPRRAASIRKPMVLRDDSEACLDADIPDIVAVIHAKKEQGLDGVSTTSGVGRRNQPSVNSIPDIDYALVSNSSYSSCNDEQPVPKKPDSTRAPSSYVSHSVLTATEPREGNRSAPSTPPPTYGSEHWKPLYTQDMWRLSKTIGAFPDALSSCQGKRLSQSSLARLKCTLDPALSDFASLFSSFDRLAKSPFSRMDEGTTYLSDGDDTDLRWEECTTGPGDCVKLDLYSSSRVLGGPESEGGTYRRRHRRNLAAMRISTTAFNAETSKENDSSHGDELAILSPEPVSPARQLRVRNSIPRLMKALPPLPQDPEKRLSQDTYKMSENEELSEDFRSDADAKSLKDADNELMPTVESAGIRTRGSEKSHGNPPRLKLRIKVASSPEIGHGAEGSTTSYKFESKPILKKNNPTALKPRLKLKLSRSHLGQGRLGQASCMKANTRLKQCNSLADLAHYSGGVVSPDHADSEGGFDEHNAVPHFGNHVPETQNEDSISLHDPSPQPSDQFNISYPPSPDKAERQLRLSTPTNKVKSGGLRSFNSDSRTSDHRGLRQKFSVLRLRIATPHVAEIPKPVEIAEQPMVQETKSVHDIGDVDFHSSDGAVVDQKGRAISMRSDKMGGRVKRWASDAKRAVRSYVRRTLDRSSRLSN